MPARMGSQHFLSFWPRLEFLGAKNMYVSLSPIGKTARTFLGWKTPKIIKKSSKNAQNAHSGVCWAGISIFLGTFWPHSRVPRVEKHHLCFFKSNLNTARISIGRKTPKIIKYCQKCAFWSPPGLDPEFFQSFCPQIQFPRDEKHHICILKSNLSTARISLVDES